MQWNDVRHNDFTKDPGRDWIAIDGNGNPIARAVDEEAIRRSAPDAAHYLQGPEKETGTFDHDGDGRAGGSLKHAPEVKQPQTLHGSNVMPATFEIDGKTVSLGEIVAAAHAKSGLSVDEWNALDDDDRDEKLGDELAERGLVDPAPAVEPPAAKHPAKKAAKKAGAK